MHNLKFDEPIKLNVNGRTITRYYETKFCQCGRQIMPVEIKTGEYAGRLEYTKQFDQRTTCSKACADAARLKTRRSQKPVQVEQQPSIVDQWLCRRSA